MSSRFTWTVDPELVTDSCFLSDPAGSIRPVRITAPLSASLTNSSFNASWMKEGRFSSGWSRNMLPWLQKLNVVLTLQMQIGCEAGRVNILRLQQYASTCCSGGCSTSSNTYGAPVEGLWPFTSGSGRTSRSTGAAVRYMFHTCSGRPSSIIFCLISRFFSMLCRLYLNSMMVLVYLFRVVTAEPMQVPNEHQAKLQRAKWRVRLAVQLFSLNTMQLFSSYEVQLLIESHFTTQNWISTCFFMKLDSVWNFKILTKFLRIRPAVVPSLGPPVFRSHRDGEMEYGGEHHVGDHPTKACEQSRGQNAPMCF